MTFFTMVHPLGLPGNRAFPGRYGPAAVDEAFPGGPAGLTLVCDVVGHVPHG
jgi:hypothetical protein